MVDTNRNIISVPNAVLNLVQLAVGVAVIVVLVLHRVPEVVKAKKNHGESENKAIEEAVLTQVVATVKVAATKKDINL